MKFFNAINRFDKHNYNVQFTICVKTLKWTVHWQ